MRPSQLLRDKAFNIGFDVAVAMRGMQHETDMAKKAKEEADKAKNKGVKNTLHKLFGGEKKTK